MEGYKIKSKKQFLDEIVETSEELLNKAVTDKSNAYKKYTKKKASGKRELYAINKSHSLYSIQKKLENTFFINFLFPECVCGFRKRKSYYDFLIPHISNETSTYYLRLDISDFFGSIQIEDIKEALSYYFIEDLSIEDKKWIIASIIDITTLNDKIIQGAITSPTVSNLIFRSLDIRIEKYCKKMGIVYTRYADDMLFSSKSSYVHNYKFKNMIKTIIKDKGFSINNKKTLMYKNEISLNGYVIGCDIRLSRKKLKTINELIYEMEKRNFTGFKSTRKKYICKNLLAGYRAFLIQSISYVNIQNTQKLKMKIEKIETLILKYCIE